MAYNSTEIGPGIPIYCCDIRLCNHLFNTGTEVRIINKKQCPLSENEASDHLLLRLFTYLLLSFILIQHCFFTYYLVCVIAVGHWVLFPLLIPRNCPGNQGFQVNQGLIVGLRIVWDPRKCQPYGQFGCMVQVAHKVRLLRRTLNTVRYASRFLRTTKNSEGGGKGNSTDRTL